MTPAQPARRTQRERRETTIALLLDAGIQTISEIGYARASVKEICSRAGVSHGALFRHFDSMLDFMVAVAAEAARRQLDNFQRGFAAATDVGDPLETALRLLRESSGNSTNTVFYELLVAARTDHELRVRLQPTLEQYGTEIHALASTLPGASAIPPDIFPTLLVIVLNIFDGEALTRTVWPMPEMVADRIPLLVDLLRGRISFPAGDDAGQ